MQSVVENVKIIEMALQDRADGRDPFGEVWQNGMMAYAGDLERRVLPLIFSDSPYAALRSSIIIAAQCAAKSGLTNFVDSDALKELRGQVTFNCGWIFFLLETYLGEAIKRYHETLPEDDGDYEEKEVIPQLEDAHFSFNALISCTMLPIKRICSSLELCDAAHIFFDMAGGKLEVRQGGLLPEEAESVMNISRVPGDCGSFFDLDECMPEASRTTYLHDVVIVLSQEMWDMASAGLGAGYVSWKIKDSISGYYLLGFSPP